MRPSFRCVLIVFALAVQSLGFAMCQAEDHDYYEGECPSYSQIEHTNVQSQPLLTFEMDRKIEDTRAIAASMVAFFLDAYRDLTLDELKIDAKKFPTKEAWLVATFDEEEADFTAQETPIHWLVAYDDKTIAGVAIFEPDSTPNRIHIRQLALAPSYRKKGVGAYLAEQLRDYVTTHYPETSSLVANVRKLNEPGLNFVRKMGFLKQPETYDGYSNENYFGFKREGL